ncbi:MAG: inositol monophosphatase [Alphaproteobacteria bacterium]
MSTLHQFETELAIRAVIDGAQIVEKRSPGQVSRWGAGRDIITDLDTELEKRIRDILSVSGYLVVGEEFGAADFGARDKSKPAWIVDPLDGTVNFLNGLDFFGVSVGLYEDGTFPVGAVCFPRSEELFCTYGGNRALLNGRRLMHDHILPNDALVVGAFSSAKDDPVMRAKEYQLFGTINDLTSGCLRLGSIAMGICYAAANKVNAVYGLRVRIWDVAGALAIARYADCKIVLGACPDPTQVNCIVGSAATVDFILDHCQQLGLMGSEYQVL